MAGDVLVAGARVTKAGSLVPVSADIEVRGRDLRYASRGGYKLQRALEVFGIDVEGLVVLDAGASTGGFTDCLLQRGARRVFAVDVGFGQLRGRLAADERVVVRERTNISDLLQSPLGEAVDLCTMDLSYLSLLKAIPDIFQAVGDVPMVCLVKPLYEGLAEPDKASMVAILEVADEFFRQLAGLGFGCTQVIVSPILGGRGATEFLALIRQGEGIGASELVEALREDWQQNPPLPTDQ